MEKKKLNLISWNVSEEEYREDKALSYSTLATYERGGFNCLSTLFEKKESSSLTFGSAVDAIITGGQSEFESKFIVANYPEIPDAIIKMVKKLYNIYGTSISILNKIPDDYIIKLTEEEKYQLNWKPETRAKVIKEKGLNYYGLLFLAGEKIILLQSVYEEVEAAVRALKESESTKFYFADNDPFDDSIERYYQLKFKTQLNGVDYRCMADELLVDYKNKIIYPIDLKTSSHTEWDFYKSFIDWNYSIQSRLYWRIIRNLMDKDDYFKDFELADYKFIVVNKKTLTPLVWEFKDTKKVGNLFYGINKQIVFRDPQEIGEELYYYLNEEPKVPRGIEINNTNNLISWLNLI